MAKTLSNRWNWLKNIVSVAVGAFFFIPFYIIISLSLKTKADRTSHWTFPAHPTFQSYAYAWTRGHVGTAILNTLIITVVAEAIILFVGSVASYPLARHKTRLNKTILSIFVGVMIVPPLTVLVPIYREMVMLHGINTYWGIILLTATYRLPWSVFMFSNFINTIPKELDEAALIDGCSQFMIFPRIILPNMMPVVSSVVILTGVNVWNDYSMQLYILQKPRLRTITLCMQTFFTEGKANMPAAAAAAVMAVLPLVVLYLFFQRYFIKGAMDSAVK